MFDGLGKDYQRQRAAYRAQTATISCGSQPRRGGDGINDNEEARVEGKKHVAAVEKNMPSMVGVFGTVDRLYRPALAQEIFGPPSTVASEASVNTRKAKAVHGSAEFGSNAVVTKPYSIERSHSAATAAVAHDIDVERLRLHVAALEFKVSVHDRSIKKAEEEAQIIAARRDLRIANKKNRLLKLRGDRTLLNQDEALTFLSKPSLSHGLAERTANRNVLTMNHSAPVFAANVGIPGQEGYMLRNSANSGDTTIPVVSDGAPPFTPPSAAAATAAAGTGPDVPVSVDTRKGNPTWAAATSLKPLDLLNRVAIPREVCATEQPIRGCRHVLMKGGGPLRLSSSQAPFACDVHQVPPRRVMTHAALSRPVEWFKREAHTLTEQLNAAVVFTPNVRPDPLGSSVMRRSTVPDPRRPPPPLAPTSTVAQGEAEVAAATRTATPSTTLHAAM